MTPKACDLLQRMSPRGDARNSELRGFVACWAQNPDSREAMIADPPKPGWRWVRGRRRDLARIAAVVHALCARDEVPIPQWVWEHRSPEHISMSSRSEALFGPPPKEDPRTDWRYWDAPDACNWHRVWFDRAFIEDKTVHGFRYSTQRS